MAFWKCCECEVGLVNSNFNLILTMARKFQFPEEFRLTYHSGTYKLVIKQLILGFLLFYGLIFLVFMVITLSFQTFWTAIPCIFVIAATYIHLSFRYVVHFNHSWIEIEGKKIKFEDIQNIKIRYTTGSSTDTSGMNMSRSSFLKAFIRIKCNTRNYTVAEDLVEDHQHSLNYVLNKWLNKDFEFLNENLDYADSNPKN